MSEQAGTAPAPMHVESSPIPKVEPSATSTSSAAPSTTTRENTNPNVTVNGASATVTAGGEKDQKSAQQSQAADRRKNMPIRQYLDQTVVPVLLAGMSQLTKERPDTDEVEWLAQWMLRNNPNKKAKTGDDAA